MGFLDLGLFATPGLYLATSLTLLLAEAVYVLFGFGAGLIAVGCLAVIMDPITDVVVLLLLVNLPLELWVVKTSWGAISWKGVLHLCVGIAVGIPLGAVALGRWSPAWILSVLGGVLLATGLVFLLLREGTQVRWPGWSAPLWGAVSGALAGMLGTGGPPLVIYYQLAGAGKQGFRGNLMAIFLLITCIRLPVYGATGLITLERLKGAALVLPAVLLGGLLGNHLHLRVREATFQRLVSLALLLIGVVLLLRR